MDKQAPKRTGKRVPTSPKKKVSSFSARMMIVIGKVGGLKEAGRITGFQDEAVARWRDEKAKAPFNAIIGLCAAADVSVDWLATGDDSSHAPVISLPGTQQEHAGDEMLQTLNDQQLADRGYVLLPRYDVQASAGQGLVNPDEEVRDFVAFDRSYLRSAGIDPAQADIIQVKGRSMMPSFVDGEWVIADRSSVRIVDDAIYAVVYGDGLLIKRLRRDPDGSVTMISDNKAEGYSDRRVSGEDLTQMRIVGRVMRHIRSV